jgi:hypothetical protein
MIGSLGIPQITVDFNIIVLRLGFPGDPEPLPPGNVADSHTPGNYTPETRLPGWGTWIRTKIEESESAVLLSHLAG